MKTKVRNILVFLLIASFAVKAQKTNLTGDTIFVNTDEELQIKFPSDKLEYRWTSLNPPYTVSMAPNSIFVHAKNDTAKCSNISVFEGPGPRNHSFIVCYHKELSKVIYDYSTVKKLQQRVQEIEAREVAKIAAGKEEPASAGNPANSNTSTNSSYYALLEEGDKALKNGQLDEAQKKYDQVLRMQPGNEFATKGLNNIKDKRIEKQKLLDKIALLKANANNAFFNKQYDEALKVYNDVLALNPGDDFSKSQIQKINAEIEYAKTQAKAKQEQQRIDSTINDLKTKAAKAFDEKRYDDAIAAYTDVLKLNVIDNLAKSKLEAIQKIKYQIEQEAKENRDRDERFKTLVSNADKAFDSKEYEVARAAYLSAKELKPNDQSLEQKLKATQEKIQGKQNQDEYSTAINAGDKALQAEDFELAEAAYKKAARIFSDSAYPTEKLALVGRKKKELETINQYKLTIEQADRAFHDKDFTNAKYTYTKASNLKPDEDYPKSKISEIDREEKARTDSIARVLDVDRKYDAAMAKGKAAFDKKEYATAKAAYTQAATLKPAEEEPKNKLELINQKQNSKDLTIQYDSAIARGNIALGDKNYALALENYKAAQRIKPLETLPLNQIRYVRGLITSDSLQQADNQRRVEVRVSEEIRKKRFNEGMGAYADYERAAQVANYEEELLCLKKFLNIIPDVSELNTYQYNAQGKIDEAKKKIQAIRQYLTRTKGSSYQPEAIPYLDIELEKKYEAINFTAPPEEQVIDKTDTALYSEYANLGKELLSEKSNLSLTDSSNHIKLTCEAIKFKNEEVLYKFHIQNNDTAEFLTGPMRFTLIKKNNLTVKNNLNYVSSFPIVLPGKEFYFVCGAKDIDVNDEESLTFELSDRLKRNHFEISILGAVYNQEKKGKP